MSLLTLRKTPSYISSRYSRFFLTLSRFVSIFFILCLISFKILDKALLTLMMIFKLAEKFRLVRKWMPSQIVHWTGLASGTKNLQKWLTDLPSQFLNVYDFGMKTFVHLSANRSLAFLTRGGHCFFFDKWPQTKCKVTFQENKQWNVHLHAKIVNVRELWRY